MTSVSELFQNALAYHRRGEFARAAERYQQVIAAEPRNVSAIHLWSVLALQTADLPLAFELAQRAIELEGTQARLHATLGQIERARGNLIAAKAASASAVTLEPDVPQHRLLLAGILQALHETEAARGELRTAAGQQPDLAPAHFELGNLEASCGRWPDAVAAFERALRCQPKFAAAELRLAVALENSGGSGALEHFRRAAGLEPMNVECQYNWGVALARNGQSEEAAQAFARTLQLDPTHVDALVNLGSYYQESGDEDRALAAYDHAITLAPAAAEAHYNRALILLARGELSAGWAEYDWRRRIPGFPIRAFDRPMWDGSPLPNQTLLVHAEQGLGDTLHFVRYLPLARKLARRTVFLAPKSLHPLLVNSGCEDLFGSEAELPAFDYHVPLMSLPALLGVNWERPPEFVPYLHASEDRVTRWHGCLERIAGRRIGIAWKGSPTHKSDLRRSIPLEAFAPVAELAGVQLVSLQKDAGAEQIAAVPFAVHQLEGEWDQSAGAFMDSAAVMQHLDLVITADTAVAHLAGAMAKPVWIALSYRPDWRWQRTGDSTPWYPTARLFRQQHPGDWRGVFQEIANALRAR